YVRARPRSVRGHGFRTDNSTLQTEGRTLSGSILIRHFQPASRTSHRENGVRLDPTHSRFDPLDSTAFFSALLDTTDGAPQAFGQHFDSTLQTHGQNSQFENPIPERANALVTTGYSRVNQL